MPGNDDKPEDTSKQSNVPFTNNQSMDAANMVAINAHRERITVALTGVQAISGIGTLGIGTLAPLPDDHPMYAVVGRIASEWSHLEHMLDLIIWDLVGADNAMIASITAQLNGTYARIKAIITLLSMHSHPEAEKIADTFTTLNGKASNIGERRHRAVHDPWYLQTPSGQAAQFKSMPYKDPQFGIRDVDKEEQAKVIVEIKKLTATAASLRDQVIAMLAASGGTPPKPRAPGLSRSST